MRGMIRFSFGEVKACVSSSVLKSAPEVLNERVVLSPRGTSDRTWVRPGFPMDDKKCY